MIVQTFMIVQKILEKPIVSFFVPPTNFVNVYSPNLKNDVCWINNPDISNLEYVINFIIMYAKLFIHKQKFSRVLPKFFSDFLLELILLPKSVKQINNIKLNT